MNTLCENSESTQENMCLEGEWTDANKHIRDRPSDSEETIIFESDYDSKIKPEVELKEDTNNFVYKPDFSGHLQLVSVENGISNHSTSVESVQHGNELTNRPVESYNSSEPGRMTQKCNEDLSPHWPSMRSMLHSSSDVQQVVISWQDHSSNNPMYRQIKDVSEGTVGNRCFIKEEPSESSPHNCSYIHSLPEIYDYSSDSTWDPQTDSSGQLTRISSSLSINGNMLLTQAEKKRLYRMRIKEENPALWSTLKKREAARKREQREKRRHVIYEMQKAMEQAAQPDLQDGINHRMYLEALKERYPELWSQLMNALPATQMRNDQLYNDRNTKSKRNIPKQAKTYRDVIEAQKKRLYRQRIKEERPEMYARQKARDAYSRSVQRHLLKKRAQKNGFHAESQMSDLRTDVNVTAIPHPEVGVPSKIPSTEVPAKSVPSQICDNSSSDDIYAFKSSPSSSDSNISELNLTKDNPHSVMGASPTQFWLWNANVPYSQWRKASQELSAEHTLLKRRQHCRGMTPQVRTEFLEGKRERLKAYRGRKKEVLGSTTQI